MKGLVLGAAVVGVALCLLLPARQALAAEKAVTLTGIVGATWDEDDNLTGVTLIVGRTRYQVVLDEKGKELAELDEKRAEVTGAVTEKGDQKWITVKTYKEVKEREEEEKEEEKKEEKEDNDWWQD